MLAWPDGARQLIGADGIVVRVEPTLWQLDPPALGILDAHMRPDMVIPMPARDPKAIPQPTAAPPHGAPAGTAPATAPEKAGTLETVTLVVLSAVAVFLVCIGGLATAGVSADKAAEGGEWAVVVALWCVVAVVALPLVFLFRRRRARRSALR